MVDHQAAFSDNVLKHLTRDSQLRCVCACGGGVCVCGCTVVPCIRH